MHLWLVTTFYTYPEHTPTQEQQTLTLQRDALTAYATQRGWSIVTIVEEVGSGGHIGLAAASVSKPTVAQYTLYFKYLDEGLLANGSGPYGKALRHPVIVVYRNFPEKSVLMGEVIVHKSLKISDILSTSFPKRPLLGKVAYVVHSGAVVPLTVGFGTLAAANPSTLQGV